MAKVRKLRRAERELHMQRVLEKRAREEVRRKKRREWWRKVTLQGWRKRSTGRLLARRSRGERAGIVVGALAALFLIWKLAPSTAMSVALTAVLLLALPVFVIVVFDKRSS